PGSAEEEQALHEGAAHTEVYSLVPSAVGGMMLFPAANGLLIALVALEVMSPPPYLLCGPARRRPLLSPEAAMKFCLPGAFPSAFFLYGTAMIYGYANSLDLAKIGATLGTVGGQDLLLYLGGALIGVGLLFKIGGAPFQAWKPDVYQGAPTPITALMASGT